MATDYVTQSRVHRMMDQLEQLSILMNEHVKATEKVLQILMDHKQSTDDKVKALQERIELLEDEC